MPNRFRNIKKRIAGSLLGAALAWLALSLCGPRKCLAVDLSPEQQKLLESMDSEAIDQALQLANQVDSWRKQLAELKTAAEQIGDDPLAGLDQLADTPEAMAVVAKITQSIQESVAEWPALAELLAYEGRIGSVLGAAEERWKSARFDPEVDFDQTEAAFREEMRFAAQAEAAVQLIETLERDVLASIEKLRDPAGYAQEFAKTTLAQWLQEPREAGGVTFRLVAVDPQKSFFSPDADIEIVIEHQEGLSVTARGLYFRYQAGQLPEPRFDKLKVDESQLTALAGSTLEFLGDAIPADFGLPIQIQRPRFNGFDAAAGLPPGSVSFDVEIGGLLDFAETLKLAAKDITIDSRGKVTVKDGFTFKDATTKVLIGTTGFIFDGYEITLRPEKPAEAVTLKTFIAPASGKESISLDITAGFGFPVRKVNYVGSLVVGRSQKMGKIEGEIGPERVNGKLTMPEGSTLPLDQILEVEMLWELNRDGFIANGQANIFGGVDRTDMDMALRFDGSGHFTGRKSYRIAGVEAGASLLAQIEKEFSRLDLTATFNIDADLKLLVVNANVEVQAASDRDQVDVVARALGAEAPFSVPNLAALTPDRIAAELMQQLPNLLENIAEAAAQWEKDKKEMLANWEGHWRETLHNEAKKYGLDAVDTGNPAANALLGNISREGKQGAAWVKDVWGKTGGEVSSFVQDPAQQLAELPSNVGREFENAGEAVQDFVGGLFSGGNDDDEPSGPSPEEIRAAELHKKVDDRLASVLAAFEGVRLDRQGPTESRRSEQRVQASATELHLLFQNAAAASEGQGNGTLGLTVASSGFRTRLNLGPLDKVERAGGSDVKAAWVEFRPLIPPDAKDVPQGQEPKRPSARIFVNALDDPSGLDATLTARIKLQELVELNLPEVEIEGPKQFVESRLAVHNRSAEPIKVWIQARSRGVQDGRFRWSWAPEEPGGDGAYSYTLAPDEKKQIEVPAAEEGQPDVPLVAASVRLWAESESGERWTEYQHDDLHLVAHNARLGGRAYFDEAIRTHVHAITPSGEERTFAERLLSMRNDTPDELRVALRYATIDGGAVRWIELPEFTIAPGATVEPQGGDGMRVRAARIRFVAEGANLMFNKHRNRSLELVDSTEGTRLYRAKHIGTYEYTFSATAEKKPTK